MASPRTPLARATPARHTGECEISEETITANDAVADSYATEQTDALFDNLLRLSDEHLPIGYQHTRGYGHGWSASPGRSGVKSGVGSHLAVVGVELNDLSAQAIACAAEK